MTMTADPMSDPQVVSILDNMRKISAEVADIDAELGTDVSGPIAARNKLAKELATKYADDNVTNFVSKIVGQFDNAQFIDSDEKRAAVFTALNTGLSAIEKSVNDFLKTQVDAQPKSDTPTISDERKAELAAQRSKQAGIFKLQKDMLKFYDVLVLPSDIVEPPVRRGAIGPRGASFTKTYQYSVDGNIKQYTDESTGEKTNLNLSQLAATVCKPLNWKTKDLRDFIIAQLNLTEVDGKVDAGDTWEVTLPEPVSKTLRGVAVNVSASAVDDSAEDEDNGTPEEDAFAEA